MIVIATQRISRPSKRGSAAQRPRSRPLTSVHDAIFEDVVVPAEIVGKCVRYHVDGSKIMKVTYDTMFRCLMVCVSCLVGKSYRSKIRICDNY